jgi:hypothetical protein
MNFSKIKLEHHGTLHVPSEYVNRFRKYFQLTKVVIVSHVNFIFERKVYYELFFFSKVKIKKNKVFRVSNFISIAKN